MEQSIRRLRQTDGLAICQPVGERMRKHMEYLLLTENLTKQYRKKKAVDSVNIHVKQGDIYGLIGRNGAG